MLLTYLEKVKWHSWVSIHDWHHKMPGRIKASKVYSAAAAAAKSLQSCPTLCDPIDGSPPGFPVPGILQARILEWVAIFFSNAWKWKVKVKSLSRVQLLATPWTAAYQAPPSMGFSRQEYWSGVRLLSLKVYSRYWEFPGGPVIRTPSFYSTGRGTGSIPGRGTKILQAVWHIKKKIVKYSTCWIERDIFNLML